MPPNVARVCEWLTEAQAFAEFARASGTIIQSQGHIRPLHWYIACRLVVEGGFFPEDITPRPPLEATKAGSRYRLISRPDLATSTEATVFGGMKSKNIDVVVSMRGIGPVLASRAEVLWERIAILQIAWKKRLATARIFTPLIRRWCMGLSH